ncbi:MAG: GNAT family N-acetyltransferase [Acidobacteriota bacterium]
MNAPRTMRRELYRMEGREALALLARSEVVHLATTTRDGAPVLRTVHGVVVDGRLCFHGAPAGEKSETVGRDAVVGVEEIVAPIPSYYVDPERACPATTYYLSVQVHGRLEAVEEPAAKARVLAALMAKYQPEGGHAPIEADHPLYRAAVAGLMIVAISLDRVDGKAKLGQNRKPGELAKVLELLWTRGDPGDPRAIELVRAANAGVPAPGFLRATFGGTLHCALGEDDVEPAVALLADAYWNAGIRPEAIAAAHRASPAWVGARDLAGKLVATARATGDRAKNAWIYDVAVAPAWRGRGVGKAVLRLLLDHPAVRGARRVWLGTKDAQGFYRAFGFAPEDEVGLRSYASTTMVLARA